MAHKVNPLRLSKNLHICTLEGFVHYANARISRGEAMIFDLIWPDFSESHGYI